MPSEATHIRFALDLKSKYAVRDVGEYIRGTVYPDSRYMTGISRELTHPENFMDWDVAVADDFKKGWFVHLLGDAIWTQLLPELLPEALEGTKGQGSETWIKSTAIKILLDINDAKKCDILSCLPYLNRAENPNGEDMKTMEEYHRALQAAYANPQNINIESSDTLWTAFRVPEMLSRKVKQKAAEYGRDERVMEKVRRIYPNMILSADTSFRGLKK